MDFLCTGNRKQKINCYMILFHYSFRSLFQLLLVSIKHTSMENTFFPCKALCVTTFMMLYLRAVDQLFLSPVENLFAFILFQFALKLKQPLILDLIFVTSLTKGNRLTLARLMHSSRFLNFHELW